MTQLHPEHHEAHDELTVGEGANVNVNRFTLPKESRDLIIGILLGLSILVNVALIYAYRDAAIQTELKRYDFSSFKDKEWTELNTRVQVNEKLITMLGKCPKEK